MEEMSFGADFRARSESPRANLAANLLDAYFAELDDRIPGGFALRAIDDSVRDELAPPSGAFLVIERRDGLAVGCGGIRRLEPALAEIKRMWVAPGFRGRGLGRFLLAALERRAADLGYERVALDTAAPLTEARRLYSSAGYLEVNAYNDNPHAAVWLVKPLERGGMPPTAP